MKINYHHHQCLGSVRIMTAILGASALLLSLVGSSLGQTYTPGSLDGQNGWSGGGGAPFSNNFADSEAITTADAHTGSQSWRLSDSYNSPGQGTPYSPNLAQAALQGTPIDTFTMTLWFKPVSLTGDDSRVAIEFGDTAGDDRAVGSFYLRNDISGGLSLSMAQAIPVMGEGNTEVVTLASGVDASVWHELTVTASLLPGDYNDIISVSFDGAAATTHNSWEEWYRDDNSFPPEESANVKFRENNNGNNGDTNYTGRGFYFDDLTYSTYNSADQAGTTQTFATGFESVPEPSSALLIGSGAILLLRRRRAAVL